MKKQTRKQIYNDLANVIGQIRRGEPVRRVGRKDGSIATHPIMPVDGNRLEHDVKTDCVEWLHKHHVFCNQHGCGSFINERGQQRMYGIKNSGDIHGMLKRHGGRHFEVECKRGSGGTLSIGQQKRMKQVRDNGGLYFVVHGVEELKYYFEDLI